MFKTLIDPEMLNRHIDDPGWVVVDCRFDLADTEAGHRAYRAGHIAGAIYAHLDDDLSGPVTASSSRHPLPTPDAMIAMFGRLGINSATQVVAYDDKNGMIAARLWWMLRYMGHESAAVLNGGWQAWLAAGYPVRSGIEQNKPAEFHGAPRNEWLAEVEDIPGVTLLLDSRAPERYRGEEEPLDPVAGRIPGAINHFYQRTWTEDGQYRPVAELRQLFADLLGQVPPGDAVFYCGSGVSACVNLLAMAHAGVGDGRLYAGSWSEWIRDPSRPVAADP